jgi:hypothetical protein
MPKVIQKRLEPLYLSSQTKKWPPRLDPDGHSYVFLNTSINKKPFFFSEVVTYKNVDVNSVSLPGFGFHLVLSLM